MPLRTGVRRKESFLFRNSSMTEGHMPRIILKGMTKKTKTENSQERRTCVATYVRFRRIMETESFSGSSSEFKVIKKVKHKFVGMMIT